MSFRKKTTAFGRRKETSSTKKKTPAKTKCTTAMKKAGKYRTTGTTKNTSTPAMEDAGKFKDEKKGQCGTSKPNNVRYHEYLKAKNAGKVGKKMRWSTGGTGTKGPGKGAKTDGKKAGAV